MLIKLIKISMLWICIALLVFAEPILAEDSNVQPNQQVQHLASLINGAILAEGVITNKIKIDDMTTDWVIVDSMPRDRDWISSLDSNPQLAEIQELLGQLGPFLDVVKNGYKKEVPMDQLEKIAKITQAAQSVSTLGSSSQKVLETFKNSFDAFTFDIVRYKQSIQFMEFLPRAIPLLQVAAKSQNLAENLQKGIDFVEEFKTIDMEKINQSLSECSKLGAQNPTMAQFVACETNLYAEVKKISESPNAKNIESSAFFLRAYHYAEKAHNFDKLIKDKLEIVKTRKNLEELLKTVNSFSKTPNETFVESFFKNVGELKSDDAKLKSLRDALEDFKTISEVICKISSHQSADNKQEAKSSNRFSSYRGLPNGTASLRDLLPALGSESKLPSKYRRSKLPERINSIKGWMDKTSYLLDNSRGLIGMYELSSNAQILDTFAQKISGSRAGHNELSEFFRNLSSPKISEAINVLIWIELQIESLEKSAWAMKLHGSMTGSSLLVDLPAWDSVFWQMSQASDFAATLIDDFKEVGKRQLNMDDMTSADRMTIHTNIMGHVNRYIELLPFVMQFSNAIQQNKVFLTLDVAKVQEMKENLIVTNDIKDGDRSSHESIPVDTLHSGLKSYHELRADTMRITDRDTTNMGKFLSDLENIEVLKKTILPLPASFDLTTTKSLLETLAGSSIGEIPGISGEANDILTNLMSGNPFGSEVLQDLATGASAYRKLVEGIDVSKLAEEISLVKADGEANGAIGKLVDGAELVQIPADPSNVYSMFADDVKLPQHIKKLSDWISRVLEAEHQTEKEYLEQNKDKFGALHALIHRVEKPMDAEFKLLSDRIEFIFRVLQDDGKLGSGSIIIIVIVVLLLIGLSAVGGFVGYKRWAKIKSHKQHDSQEGKKPKKPEMQMGVGMKVAENRDFMSSRIYFDKGQVCFSDSIKKYEVLMSQVIDEYNTLPSINIVTLLPADIAKMFHSKEDRIAGAQWKHNLVNLPSGKYIPASKIGGFKDRKFIAAQAPLKCGIEKFFEMLFVEKVTVILQLCATPEMQKSDKGRESWSYEDEPVAGVYTVKTRSLLPNQIYGIFENILNITDTRTGKTIHVTHMSHELWPDSSVPNYFDDTVTLLQRINMLAPKGSTVLVHCKAGIGRTMTFITAARCIEKIEHKETPFYFLDVATQMRKERNMALQNVLQYAYVFGVVTTYMEMVKGAKPNTKFWSLYQLAFDCLYKTRKVSVEAKKEEKEEDNEKKTDSVTDVEVSAKEPEPAAPNAR